MCMCMPCQVGSHATYPHMESKKVVSCSFIHSVTQSTTRSCPKLFNGIDKIGAQKSSIMWLSDDWTLTKAVCPLIGLFDQRDVLGGVVAIWSHATLRIVQNLV